MGDCVGITGYNICTLKDLDILAFLHKMNQTMLCAVSLSNSHSKSGKNMQDNFTNVLKIKVTNHFIRVQFSLSDGSSLSAASASFHSPENKPFYVCSLNIFGRCVKMVFKNNFKFFVVLRHKNFFVMQGFNSFMTEVSIIQKQVG